MPRVTIIGFGNWGTALTGALVRAGVPVREILLPMRSDSRKRARKLFPRIPIGTVGASPLHADLLWICTPDAEIANVASELASRLENLPRRRLPIVFHSSGALDSGELAPLRTLGIRVASVHPLMSFPRSARTATRPYSLAGVPFAVEGDAAAQRLARKLVRSMKGDAFSLAAADKPLYHAYGAFASPLLTAALTAAMQAGIAAGYTGREAQRRMRPMVERTMRNFFESGTEQGFSGPLARGDAATIQRHLDALRPFPALLAMYAALSSFALQTLPSRNTKQLLALLQPRD